MQLFVKKMRLYRIDTMLIKKSYFMKKLLIVIVLLTANNLFAQKQMVRNSKPDVYKLEAVIPEHSATGTFRVVYAVNSKQTILISKKLLNEIEMGRKEFTSNYLIISENIKIEIFSKELISSPSFTLNN